MKDEKKRNKEKVAKEESKRRKNARNIEENYANFFILIFVEFLFENLILIEK